MDYFNDVFTTFLGLNSGSCVAVNGGTKKLSFKRCVLTYEYDYSVELL